MSDNRNMTDLPGIYVIRNLVNDKVYVGQAVNIRRRWNIHKHLLRKGTHTNLPLQRSFLKHGEQAFSFELVETVALDRLALNAAEERQIATLGACDGRLGYNLTPTAGTNLGCKYSEESRARMRVAQKGRTFSDEARAAISATLTGRVQSPETIAKRVEKTTGMRRSVSQIANVKEALRGFNHTQKIAAFGREMFLSDWACEYGIHISTLHNRVFRSGESLEQALSGDKRSCGKKNTKKYDVFGVSDTLLGHSVRHGVKIKSVRNYVGRNKMTAQQAIEHALLVGATI